MELKEQYYNNKKIAIVAHSSDFAEDLEDYEQDENDYYRVCNDQLMFKKVLPLPGLEEGNDFDEPDYYEDNPLYLDRWEQAKLFNCPKFIVDRKCIFFDDEESINDFNEKYETNFETFGECFDFATSEDDGLCFSVDVIEDYTIND